MSTLVFQGRRRVIGIALPKGKPDSPMRNVELELQGSEKYPFSGWIFADKLGEIAIGDLVACIIEKSDEGYKNVTSIEKVSGDLDGHTPEVASGGGDRAEHPAESPPEAPAARDNPTGRENFDSYAYLAACGMVDLAYEELCDAKDAGDIEAVTPSLVAAVSRVLLLSADLCVRNMAGHVDRNSKLHTRARGTVRTVLRTYPVASALTEDPMDLEAWGDKITKAAGALLKIAGTI